MTSNPTVIWHPDDELYVAIDQGAVHLRAVAAHNDPIELSVEEAQRLAEKLVEACQRIEDSEQL